MLEHVTVFERATETKVEAKLVIRGFVRELTLCEPGKEFLSDTFMVGDTPMEIRVYPNGYTDEHKGHVSVFLKNKHRYRKRRPNRETREKYDVCKQLF